MESTNNQQPKLSRLVTVCQTCRGNGCLCGHTRDEAIANSETDDPCPVCPDCCGRGWELNAVLLEAASAAYIKAWKEWWDNGNGLQASNDLHEAALLIIEATVTAYLEEDSCMTYQVVVRVNGTE